MESEFWLQAWRDGRRGFHKGEVHADLADHAEKVFAKGTVLVPLCGVTHDLAWLVENGWTAIGIELSPIAVQELAEREGLSRTQDRGPFEVYENGPITVLQGDFFKLEVEHVGVVGGIWDRAAMVALHPSQREAYAAVERRLLHDGGRMLLNVLDYDASKLDGPPWAVSPAAVTTCWPGALLVDERTDPAEGRFAEQVDTMTRRLYRVSV